MTLNGLKRLLNQKNFNPDNLPNRTGMVYQGKGFSGHIDIGGDRWKSTHCWSPVAAQGVDLIVHATHGTPVSKTLFEKFIKYCKDISPNVRKNIEDYPPTREPLKFHFYDHTGTTGYPQYYVYVLWKQLFQNPKGVAMWVYFRDLGFDAAEAFVLLMQLKEYWYKEVYGGRILEYPSEVDGAEVLENLRNVDTLPHTGNYQMRNTVAPTRTTGFTMLLKEHHSHIESLDDFTEENLRVVIDLYNTNHIKKEVVPVEKAKPKYQFVDIEAAELEEGDEDWDDLDDDYDFDEDEDGVEGFVAGPLQPVYDCRCGVCTKLRNQLRAEGNVKCN